MKINLPTALIALAFTACSSAYAIPVIPPTQLHTATDLTPPLQAGILSCAVDQEADPHPACVFHHSAGQNAFRETYDTKLTRSLIEQSGVKGSTLMRWAVYTPGGEAMPGMLLGAQPSEALQADDGATSSVKISFLKDGQRITLQQLGDATAARLGGPKLSLVPSAAPLDVPAKQSLQITVIR
jgi:hypothetical protein